MAVILVVEDQPDVQKLLEVALGSSHRLLTSLSAEEAWQILQEENPDLILLDIMMPGSMDGRDLLRMVRAETRFDRVKIIVMSARTQNQDRQAVLEAGADAFIAKPFRLNELRALLKSHLSAT